MKVNSLIMPAKAGISLVLAFALAVGMTGTLFARTINVPDDYETIQAGIDAAEDGDTVLVAAGTYRGEGNRDLNMLGKPITLLGDGGANRCEIDLENTAHRGFQFVDHHESRESVIEGFTIKNGSLVDFPARGDRKGGAIYMGHSVSPTIRKCIIRNNYARTAGGGLYIGPDCFPKIDNCVIIQNSCRDYEEGIGGAIAVTGSEARVEIDNCTIAANRSFLGDGLSLSGDGQGPNGNVILHNTIIKGLNSDIYIGEGQNGAEGVDDLTISFCNLNNNRQGQGNIDSDPQFIDPDNGDFHLRRGSPCVNAGDPESPEDTDGTRADMGAYPFNYEGPITLNVPDEYATIQAGIDDAIEGDTVLVEAGNGEGHNGEYI
jgi:hypothetical protein